MTEKTFTIGGGFSPKSIARQMRLEMAMSRQQAQAKSPFLRAINRRAVATTQALQKGATIMATSKLNADGEHDDVKRHRLAHRGLQALAPHNNGHVRADDSPGERDPVAEYIADTKRRE